MTKEEFEQLEFEHADAITKAEQVYRDTEGDLSRAIIAAIQAQPARELTVEELQESMEAFIGYPFEQSKGLAKAFVKLGTIRIVGDA